MAIWWKYLFCSLVLNLAIVEAENVVGATSNYIGGVFNYFVPGIINESPSNTTSNLEEDNDPKYNVDNTKWSNFYDELIGEVSANPLILPRAFIDISIQRLNETSLYFRHLCLLNYNNLMEAFQTQESEIESSVVGWNSLAIKALQISAESFKETLIERCQTSSYHLTDKYVTYIKHIFADNIVDFLIFMNEQKTDEDVAEIKELMHYGKSDLDAAAKHYVTTYRTLTISGERRV